MVTKPSVKSISQTIVNELDLIGTFGYLLNKGKANIVSGWLMQWYLQDRKCLGEVAERWGVRRREAVHIRL